MFKTDLEILEDLTNYVKGETPYKEKHPELKNLLRETIYSETFYGEVELPNEDEDEQQVENN